MSRVRNEVLLALELVALTSFAFARAILSAFGDTPGAVRRRASGSTSSPSASPSRSCRPSW